jgi:ATP/ADP translocase
MEGECIRQPIRAHRVLTGIILMICYRRSYRLLLGVQENQEKSKEKKKKKKDRRQGEEIKKSSKSKIKETPWYR